jgi:hypothetical protein
MIRLRQALRDLYRLQRMLETRRTEVVDRRLQCDQAREQAAFEPAFGEFGMAGAVQWVAPSAGVSSRVRVTTASAMALGRGGMRDGRFRSRSRRSTPAAMNRSFQRQTCGFDTPARHMISAVPHPSAVARSTAARHASAGSSRLPRSP